ncbi:hypothetical protein A3Q56_06554 [Intoshia linei]|uniref:Uncharacterized protein n=1 Tax=Intoshia linei TaxID=1819745 RepID=A0A177AUQ2_9BILA|nr:hypothetical protein A3Q56_06554 [Intoshia linei]
MKSLSLIFLIVAIIYVCTAKTVHHAGHKGGIRISSFLKRDETDLKDIENIKEDFDNDEDDDDGDEDEDDDDSDKDEDDDDDKDDDDDEDEDEDNDIDDELTRKLRSLKSLTKKIKKKTNKSVNKIKNNAKKAAKKAKKAAKKAKNQAKNLKNRTENKVKNLAILLNRRIVYSSARQFKRDAVNRDMCNEQEYETEHPYQMLKEINPEEFEEKKNHFVTLLSHCSEFFDNAAIHLGEFFENDISFEQFDEMVEKFIDSMEEMRDRYGPKFEEIYTRFMEFYVFNYKGCDSVTKEEAQNDECVREAMNEIFELFGSIDFGEPTCVMVPPTGDINVPEIGNVILNQLACFSREIADIAEYVANTTLPANVDDTIVLMVETLTQIYKVGLEIHEFQYILEQCDQTILNSEGNPSPEDLPEALDADSI